jgi:hypothetical protein
MVVLRAGPASRYAWQYIFAIVAFSIKLFCRGTKQVALISSESVVSDGMIQHDCPLKPLMDAGGMMINRPLIMHSQAAMQVASVEVYLRSADRMIWDRQRTAPAYQPYDESMNSHRSIT